MQNVNVFFFIPFYLQIFFTFLLYASILFLFLFYFLFLFGAFAIYSFFFQEWYRALGAMLRNMYIRSMILILFFLSSGTC